MQISSTQSPQWPPASPARRRKPLSLRCAADRFSVSRASVQRAITTLTNPEPIASRWPRLPGRPRALTRHEDEPLVSYVLWLQRGKGGLPHGQGAAGSRCQRPPPAQEPPEAADLGRNWYSRWLSEQPEPTRYGYVRYARIKDTYSNKGGGADKGVKPWGAS
ncbi:hypothetical protein CCMA1212_005841 [Trichoderma ghanense]|uniref:Transposase n=1 Tax=Trichoderma ghanense TaxID=65468 RepID=A0ABY2H2V7_9HYPO